MILEFIICEKFPGLTFYCKARLLLFMTLFSLCKYYPNKNPTIGLDSVLLYLMYILQKLGPSCKNFMNSESFIPTFLTKSYSFYYKVD